jgi:transcriptional regulator with XRE-family HTH domain
MVKQKKAEAVVIGKRFRELREILKKTQLEFSKELKVTQANVSLIESGKCLPNFTFNKRLSEKFPDVNFNWLLYGDGSPIRHNDVSKIKRDTEQKVTKEVEKSYMAKIHELENELERLKKDNSKLINLLTHSKK